MKQKFVDINFKPDSMAKIILINRILEEYRRQGFRLSLRQTYYQLVARGYIENSQRSYKNVGNLISNGRQAGLIDWDMMINRDTVLLFDQQNKSHLFDLSEKDAKWVSDVVDPTIDDWEPRVVTLTHHNPNDKIAVKPAKQLSYLLDK